MLLQGKVGQLSGYDPLDLFSGTEARVSAALQALLRQPQNNFRLFRDGQALPFRCQKCSAYRCDTSRYAQHTSMTVPCERSSG